MKQNPKIVISGGGTGGHIYPAVAIAHEIRRQFSDAEILFVGALGKMEMEKVPKAGFRIVGLPIAGINRSNMLANLSFPIKLAKSLGLARKILKEVKPDLAIGVGGYASGPTLLMANLLGIPTLIQEQNSYAGLTNRFLAKKARKICVAYPGMDRFFPAEKIAYTGNPVRSDIVANKISRTEALKHFGLNPEVKTALIIGGSQGALSINKAVAAGLGQFQKAEIQLVWQTGKNFFENAMEAKQKLNYQGCTIEAFIYEMDKAYAAADVVISRAGALSVSELCLSSKSSILVPFPNAAEDHQTKNAESLAERNAAVLIDDKVAGDKLVTEAIQLIFDEARQNDLAKNIAAFAKPAAASMIVEEMKKILEA